MKKLNTILVAVIALFTFSAAWGQVEITKTTDTTTLINGQTYDASLDGSNSALYFYVKNISTHAQFLNVIRRQLTPVNDPGLDEQLCFGAGFGLCVPVTTTDSIFRFPDSTKFSSQQRGTLEIHFNNYSIPTDLEYRYYIVDAFDNKIDSIDISAKTIPGLGVKEVAKNANVSVNIYPNPVSDVLNININGTQSSNNTVRLVDVLGKTVYMGHMDNAKKLNVSDMNNGVYILKVSDGLGNVLQNKRIIIRH